MNEDASADPDRSEDETLAKTTAAQNAPPTFVFETMSRGGKVVLINHNEQIYRLRVTKNGKLILNK